MKNIENNSVEALKVCGYLLGGMLAATIGFFVENNNINKTISKNIYLIIRNTNINDSSNFEENIIQELNEEDL